LDEFELPNVRCDAFYDPRYRLILLREIAWAIDEKHAHFMPLVYHGITNEKGLVGASDSMMDYKNRIL
jgi:hypothetical protein